MLCFFSDLWQEKFQNCHMENTTFLHPKKGCHLNFEEENDIVIYMVSFLGSLAVLPGNIVSALFMDKIGRIRIIGEQPRRSSLQAGPGGSIPASAPPSPSRRLHAGVVCLHLPAAAEFQPRGCDLLAVPLLRRQRGGLERTRGHLRGALPFLKEVLSQTSPHRIDPEP